MSFPLVSVNQIGHTSPPKFKVVDTSQEYLSVCFSNFSPFSYNLAYDFVGDIFYNVCLFIF